MPRTAAIQTLGCKVNSYESELIGESLRRAGWRLSDADQPADLYVINTCTVTREADRQARQAVRRLVRRNPDALVVVTGCYAQMDGEACARIPGVDLVLGNDRKLDLVRFLPGLEQGSQDHGRRPERACLAAGRHTHRIRVPDPGVRPDPAGLQPGLYVLHHSPRPGPEPLSAHDQCAAAGRAPGDQRLPGNRHLRRGPRRLRRGLGGARVDARPRPGRAASPARWTRTSGSG